MHAATILHRKPLGFLHSKNVFERSTGLYVARTSMDMAGIIHLPGTGSIHSEQWNIQKSHFGKLMVGFLQSTSSNFFQTHSMSKCLEILKLENFYGILKEIPKRFYPEWDWHLNRYRVGAEASMGRHRPCSFSDLMR